ncbi:hypothetical protein ACJ41O_011638 [Fusarium nematophilum]
MPPDPTPPLPLAANRAALSNRISLLLSSQSSVLKTMNLSRPPPPSSSTASAQRRRNLPDDDEDFARGSRPNEGVGYVPDKKDAQKMVNSKEERMLRGRTGKMGRGGGKAMGRRVDESESEEEVGRSALGKRKRPRREVEPEAETPDGEAGEEAKEEEAKGDVDMEAGTKVVEDVGQSATPSDGTTNKKRKKKNKKKKQKQKNGDGE